MVKIKSSTPQPQLRRSAREPKKRGRSPSSDCSISSGRETEDRFARVSRRLRGASPDMSWSPEHASSSDHERLSPASAGGPIASHWPPLFLNGALVNVVPAPTEPGALVTISPPAPPAGAIAAFAEPVLGLPAATTIVPGFTIALGVPAVMALGLPAASVPELPASSASSLELSTSGATAQSASIAAPAAPPPWWKTGALTPGILEDVHLASDPLFRYIPGAFPQGEHTDAMRRLAHHGDVQKLFAWLTRAGIALREGEFRVFGASFEALPSPTVEQVDKINEAQMTLRLARLHAVVHTLVGSASILDKLCTLQMLSSGQPTLLADLRMGDLNLLHIACMVPMSDADRSALVRYFKQAGVNPAAESDKGMTPLHHLATLPESTRAMAALMGWVAGAEVNINACNREGETPLHVAYATQSKNKAVIEWLIGRGANLFNVNKQRQTTFDAVFKLRGWPSPQRPYLGSTPETAVPPAGWPVVPQ